MSLRTFGGGQGGGGGGGNAPSPNWAPIISAATAITNTVLRWIGVQAAGVSITQAPARLTMAMSEGTAISGQYSGTVKPQLSSGTALTTTANLGTRDSKPAAEIVQIKYDLTGNYGATSAASAPVTGSQNWTNPANATGANNATNATLVATLTAAANTNLNLGYATLPNKTALTITKVEVIFYAQITAGTLQTVSMTYSYGLAGTGGAFTALQTFNAAQNDSAGRTFDITAAIGGNWTNLQNFAARVNGNLATSTVSGTASVDAVVLRVTATHTQAN